MSSGQRDIGGYRSNPALTLGGFVRAMLFVAAYVAGVWLLGRAIGELLAKVIVGFGMPAWLAWIGLRGYRHPLAGDEYATEEERREARRAGAFAIFFALGLALVTAGRLLLAGRHG